MGIIGDDGCDEAEFSNIVGNATGDEGVELEGDEVTLVHVIATGDE